MRTTLAALLLVAACGTTVPQVAGSPRSGPDGLGGGTSAAPLPTTSGRMEPVAPTATVVVPVVPGASAASAAPPSSVPSGPAPPGAPASLGRGVTSTTITLGVLGLTNAAQTFSAQGANPVATGDNENQAAAILRYVNAHGGIAGRLVKAEYYAMDFAKTAANPDAELAAMCTHFTQDVKVFAVLGYTGVGDTGLRCLAKSGIPLLDDYGAPSEKVTAELHSFYYAPSDLTGNRVMRVYATGLAQAHWFGPHPRIGVLVYDAQTRPRVDSDLLPTLKRFGYSVSPDDIAVYSGGSSGPDNQSFALRFAQHHVTHVLLVDVSPLFFMQAAESQQYRPLYGLYSSLAPGSFLQTSAPRAQLHGSLSIGWEPAYDVDSGNDPGPVSPNATTCAAIMHAAGLDDGRVALDSANKYCDDAFVLQAALRDSRGVTVSALEAGYERLGASYRSPVTFRTLVGPGRHDGAAAYRLDPYVDDCSCFRYTSGNRPMS